MRDYTLFTSNIDLYIENIIWGKKKCCRIEDFKILARNVGSTDGWEVDMIPLVRITEEQEKFPLEE